MRNLIKKQAGFTLLELLIVIVIIGILALIIVPGLASGPARARDTQRKADIRTIRNGVETYFSDHGYYPGATSDLVSDNILKTVPTDPKTNGAYSYAPTQTGGGACTTAAKDCTKYTLSATLEKDGSTFSVTEVQ